MVALIIAGYAKMTLAASVHIVNKISVLPPRPTHIIGIQIKAPAYILDIDICGRRHTYSPS